MAKVEIKITVEIDANTWADTYGGYEWEAVQDAKGLLGDLAAGRLKEHDMVTRVVTVNGKMEPTI